MRQKALTHLLECVDIMDATGSRDLKLWFADGTNYPGQDDIVARQDRLAEALRAVYARLGPDQRMLLEYKLFEPSFYTTDVPDWGTSLLHCQALGPKAQAVVDTGHHAPGVNIEFIVALLLRAGRLGGFDFNSRFYADDDLMVGAADPFQLFRIMHEVAKAGALITARSEGAGLREEMGLAPDPVAAYLASGYGERIIMERAGIPSRLFPPLRHPGDVIGPITADGVPGGLPLVAVASHDTASAVVAMPPRARISRTSPRAPGRWWGWNWPSRC